MSTLARELAELIVDRDSFTVNGELTGQNKIDYEGAIKHYTNVIRGGLMDIKSTKSVKAGDRCWVCFQLGADTTGVVCHAMPMGLPCPPKEVCMHTACKASYKEGERHERQRTT